MTSGNLVSPGAVATRGAGGGSQPANLGDILERILDKGLVIAGDIQVNLLDIELLTIKLRLVIASLDTARQAGINWWESDPWLSARAADASRSADADGSRAREVPGSRSPQVSGSRSPQVSGSRSPQVSGSRSPQVSGSRSRELEAENRDLRRRIEALESGQRDER